MNHLVDTFLEGILGDEAVDEDVLVLADALCHMEQLRIKFAIQ